VTDLLANAWIDPVVQPSRWWLFAAFLAASVVLTVAFSPRRRAAMGAIKLAAAHGSSVVVPLAGVFIVRSGFRHAYELDGRPFWESMWLSLLWMLGFIAVGQLAVRTVPPTSWLIRDLRQAGRDVWRDRLRRWFGGGR